MSPNAVGTNGRTGKRRRTQQYQNLKKVVLIDERDDLQTLHELVVQGGDSGGRYIRRLLYIRYKGNPSNLPIFLLFDTSQNGSCFWKWPLNFTKVNFKGHPKHQKVSNFWVGYFLKTLKSTQKVLLVLRFAMTSNIPWRMHGPWYIYIPTWKPSFMKRSCREIYQVHGSVMGIHQFQFFVLSKVPQLICNLGNKGMVPNQKSLDRIKSTWPWHPKFAPNLPWNCSVIKTA